MWWGSEASIMLEDDEIPLTFSSDSGSVVNALEGG